MKSFRPDPDDHIVSRRCQFNSSSQHQESCVDDPSPRFQLPRDHSPRTTYFGSRTTIANAHLSVGKLESNICVKHGCRTVSKYNDVSGKTKPLIFQKFGRLPYTIYPYRTHLIQKWDPSDPIRMTIVSRDSVSIQLLHPEPRIMR